MGLFSKKSMSETIKCPNCGQEYIIPAHQYDKHYLDGMYTMPISKMMEMAVVCSKCGLLHSTQDLSGIWKTQHKTAEYKAAMDKVYLNDTERKLALWDALSHSVDLVMYWAHYYNEINDVHSEQQMLHKAIQYIESKKDNYAAQYNLHEFAALHHYYGIFAMTPEVRLVDLYRRTSQWEKAIAQIDMLRQKTYVVEPDALFVYLDLEEKLVQKHNHQLQ